MTSYLKEVMDAMGSRLRSPFFGSIAVVFALANWKPLFYLMFSNEPVSVRLRFFDLNTDPMHLYYLPIGLGIIFALAAPWLRFAGAYVAARPMRHMKALHDEEAIERKIADLGRQARLQDAQAAEEAARERRLIEEAKRNREIQEFGDVDLERLIGLSRNENIDLGNIEKSMLGPSERAFGALERIARTPMGSISAYESDGSFQVIMGAQRLSVSDRRNFLNLKDDINLLTENGLLEKVPNQPEWKMTQEGYKLVEQASPEYDP